MFHEIHFQIVLLGYTGGACRVNYRDKCVMRSLRLQSREISEFDLLTNDLGTRFPRVQYICIYVAIRIMVDINKVINKNHGWKSRCDKAKCRSDRSIMLRAIDLDPIRFDLFSHFIVLHACLPVDTNGLQELQRCGDL